MPATPPKPSDPPPSDCRRPSSGRMSEYFPNVVVHSHLNQRFLFYDDLLRGKLVMIHCMSIRTEPVFRSIQKLAQVQQALGDRVGRDVFLYSVTIDPEHDTPRALQAFAALHGARPGWLFLTGEPANILAIRARLYAGAAPHVHGAAASEDCSMGLIRYGNEAVGLWASVAVMQDPASIAQRIAWIETKAPPSGAPKRRGPPPLPTAFRNIPPLGNAG